jgi:S-adenosylmethionine hydrolase
MPIVTFTTDFGEASPYVAVMKGVILSIAPDARLLDLTHRIRPQDLRHADYFLGTCVPHFPPGTIHLAVIDPGVGGERRPILIETGGQVLVGPDNGLFTRSVHALGGTPTVRSLENPQYRRAEVSATFHGRDLFAPAAAHLSRGVSPTEFGPVQADWVRLSHRTAVCWQNLCSGDVQFIDEFGNLITNIPAGRVKELPIHVSLDGGPPHPIRWVRTYSDAAPGEVVSLFSSDGFVEIAQVNGNAATKLNATIGMRVEVRFG